METELLVLGARLPHHSDSPMVFRFPATFTFVLRAFSTLEGIGRVLDPDYKFTAVATPYAQQLLDIQVGMEQSCEAATWDGILAGPWLFPGACSPSAAWLMVIACTVPLLWGCCRPLQALLCLTAQCCHHCPAEEQESLLSVPEGGWHVLLAM